MELVDVLEGQQTARGKTSGSRGKTRGWALARAPLRLPVEGTTMSLPQTPRPLDPVTRGAALSDEFAAFVDFLVALAPDHERQRLQQLIALIAAQARREAQPADLAAFRHWADGAGPEEAGAFVRVLAASMIRAALLVSEKYAGIPVPPPLEE